MPRCSAAADGCCAAALPFAAAAARSAPRGPGSGRPPAPDGPQRLQPPATPRLPPPSPSRPLCPAAMNPPAAAGGEETGAAGGGCRGAEGGGEAAGAAGVPEEPGLAAAEESLEEKLRNLTFRKQVSYRWVPPARARGGSRSRHAAGKPSAVAESRKSPPGSAARRTGGPAAAVGLRVTERESGIPPGCRGNRAVPVLCCPQRKRGRRRSEKTLQRAALLPRALSGSPTRAAATRGAGGPCARCCCGAAFRGPGEGVLGARAQRCFRNRGCVFRCPVLVLELWSPINLFPPCMMHLDEQVSNEVCLLLRSRLRSVSSRGQQLLSERLHAVKFWGLTSFWLHSPVQAGDALS